MLQPWFLEDTAGPYEQHDFTRPLRAALASPACTPARDMIRSEWTGDGKNPQMKPGTLATLYKPDFLTRSAHQRMAGIHRIERMLAADPALSAHLGAASGHLRG